MKNHTGSKTTFGDWSANYYIFRDPIYNLTKEKFLSIFGGPNILKNNRFSWSGRSCPKVEDYNTFGQKLEVDEDGNIFAIYSYEKDQRVGKLVTVPEQFRNGQIILAKWSAEKMRKRVEDKFDKLGWFKCERSPDGTYHQVAFGDPIKFEQWIDGVRQGLIFLDSGMYQGNSRNYSQWRAENKYWDELVTDRH